MQMVDPLYSESQFTQIFIPYHFSPPFKIFIKYLLIKFCYLAMKICKHESTEQTIITQIFIHPVSDPILDDHENMQIGNRYNDVYTNFHSHQSVSDPT